MRPPPSGGVFDEKQSTEETARPAERNHESCCGICSVNARDVDGSLFRCANATCNMVGCSQHQGGNDDYDLCSLCAAGSMATEAAAEEEAARARAQEHEEAGSALYV